MLVYNHDHPHPWVDTAFPPGDSQRQRRASSRRTGFRVASLHKLIRVTLGLWSERSVREYLCTLRGWDEVVGEAIESSLEPTSELLHASEGVSFTPHVLNCGLIPRCKVEPD